MRTEEGLTVQGAFQNQGTPLKDKVSAGLQNFTLAVIRLSYSITGYEHVSPSGSAGISAI